MWCHGLIPDQHAFRGSYGGWVFPLWDHAGEGIGHRLDPALVSGLSSIYGIAVMPQGIFDVILALLSASTYTTRFSHDLEDGFPHIPFPSDSAVFMAAAELGARIRSIQTFDAVPAQVFRRARLVGLAPGRRLDVPAPRRTFIGEGGTGTLALVADQSLRVAGVSENAWRFSVSGYPVLYRWLRARNGEALDAALQRNLLDTIARIEEILCLFDEADDILEAAMQAPLTRQAIGIQGGAGAVES